MTDRYHALDSLRAFAMFLGIALHAAISFLVTRFPLWPVRDNDPTPLADVFLIAVHDFRLQLFFLLAGFFACLLYQRSGVIAFVRHRVRRVLIPLILGVAFIVPTVMMVFLYAEIENYRHDPSPGTGSDARPFAMEVVAEHPGQSTIEIVVAVMFSSRMLDRLPPPAHLWFLYYLMFLYAAVALLAPLLSRLKGTRILAAIDAAFRSIATGRLRIVIPTLITVPVLFTMSSGLVDTPTGWRPLWNVIGYYGVFFIFGWMLFRHRELVDSFGRGWRLNLAAASFLVLPAMIGLTIEAKRLADEGAEGVFAWQLGAFTAQAVYSWMMIVSLWGAFLHWFGRGSAWSRYLADASYWCYLASITPIVLLQFWLADWPLPGVVKFAFITMVTMGLLLASYEWCVRYTVIGAILNGRKVRVRRPRQSLTAHTESSSRPCSVASADIEDHGS